MKDKGKEEIRGFKRIESLMKENPDEELVIERQYLPEIIDEDLLEISRNDNLPILTRSALNKFEIRGIMTEYSHNKVKFYLIEKRVKEILNNRFDSPDDLQSLIDRREGIKRLFGEFMGKFSVEGVKYLKRELNRVHELIDKEVGNPLKITLDNNFRTLKVEKDYKRNDENS